MHRTKSGKFEIGRKSIRDEGWILERIDEAEGFQQFEKFCCEDEDLDDFIINNAIQHKEELIAETYVLKATGNSDIPVAFISFSNDAIPLSKEEKRNVRFPYRYLPAVKIARLGVHKDFQGKNIGTFLINMTKEFFVTDNRTGCRFLTVDAYNKTRVIKFYEKNDFRLLRAQEGAEIRVMFLDLKRLQI